MGLFEGIRKTKFALNVELDTQHSLMILVLGSVYSDNWESKEEMLVVHQMMCKSPIFKDSDDANDTLILKQCKSFMDNNDDALDQACAYLPPPLKETAFAMAVEVVFADGVIDPKEAEFIDTLSKQLSIGKTKAKSIIQTFDILYRDK